MVEWEAERNTTILGIQMCILTHSQIVSEPVRPTMACHQDLLILARHSKQPTQRVMTPPMQTPGPSNGEPRPIPQGPSTTTHLGPKPVGTLRAGAFLSSLRALAGSKQRLWFAWLAPMSEDCNSLRRCDVSQLPAFLWRMLPRDVRT